MISFGMQVILLLVLISGVISYVGDRIGRSIGRKRLTLFGLRPLHTAIAITVISGMLIALITFLSMIVISKDARTALFGLEQLRSESRLAKEDLQAAKKELLSSQELLQRTSRELSVLQKDLTLAKEDISRAEKLKKGLKAEIDKARSGSMLFSKGEVIMVNLIRDQADLNKALRTIAAYLQSIQFANRDYLDSYLATHKGESVVKVVVDNNVVLGDPVTAHFEVLTNELMYDKGDIIAEAELSDKTREAVEERLKELLSQAHDRARQKGMVPDINGSIGSVPYAKIFEASKIVNVKRKPVRVYIKVTKNTFAIGPLEVDFLIQ